MRGFVRIEDSIQVVVVAMVDICEVGREMGYEDLVCNRGIDLGSVSFSKFLRDVPNESDPVIPILGNDHGMDGSGLIRLHSRLESRG